MKWIHILARVENSWRVSDYTWRLWTNVVALVINRLMIPVWALFIISHCRVHLWKLLMPIFISEEIPTYHIIATPMIFFTHRSWIFCGIISPPFKFTFIKLIYLGRVTQICVKKLITIGSDNGLSPGRRLAIIWNNAVIYFIRHIGKNFSEFLIEIQTFTKKKVYFKMSSGDHLFSVL